MLSMFVVWLTLLPLRTAAHVAIDSPAEHRHFHIRVLDPRLDSLVDTAMMRSATFAALVAQVEGTDIIVHVDRVMTLPPSLRAQVAFMGDAGAVRYLRIEIRATLNDKETLATLAHELRHAVEIGEAREVRSDADVCALYLRIGEERAPLRFDSYEAEAAGRQVQIELLEPRQP
jgi:hypothetical protein